LLVGTPTTTVADQKKGSGLSAEVVGGLMGGIVGIILLISLAVTFYLMGRRNKTKPPNTTTAVTVETPNEPLHEARDRSEEIADVGGRLRRSQDLSTIGGRLRYPNDDVIEGGRLGSITAVTVETPNEPLHETRDRFEEIAEAGGRLRRDRSQDLSTVGGRLRYPNDEVIEGGRLGSPP